MIRRLIGKTLLAGIGIAAAWLAPVSGVPGAAHAAVVSQGPCVSDPDDFCVSFGASGKIPDIRHRSFDASSPGKAIVTFHGSLTCANFTAVKGGVQVSTQIVDDPDAKPRPTRPGGLTLMSTLPPQGRAAFNLASTRVFAIPVPGRYTYYFKVRRVELAPTGSECRVYNAVFTIQFEPALP